MKPTNERSNIVAVSNFFTTGDVARRYRLTRSAVNYAIEKAGIEPAGWIGNARVFSRDQLPAIRAALENVHVRAPRSQPSSLVGLAIAQMPDAG